MTIMFSAMMNKTLTLALFGWMVRFASGSVQLPLPTYCSIIYDDMYTGCLPFPGAFLDFKAEKDRHAVADVGVLQDAYEALEVFQSDYFDPNYGTWPAAIDWTAAVCETVLSGMLTTLTKSLDSDGFGNFSDWKRKENLISSFYEHIVSSYFGQDELAIRGQAYDDILWVVLGWIEAINFVSTHETLHYAEQGKGNSSASEPIRGAMRTLPWHGKFWVRVFAHRARIFWNLAARGWDTEYCHGGMVWNPRLLPYKNAITNELWISASVVMYRDFPGDNFTSPWVTAGERFPETDPAHLAAAIEGYRWLMAVNMTNSQGLFIDGFHISSRSPDNVECDVRDEMVYTYNQGVILTGQRGLWAVTGSPSYLWDGHRLVQSVIEATGWNLRRNSPTDDNRSLPDGRLPPWRGLGRGGILEERCDASGTCSQDGQTFKGIFFHHFTAFCSPLDPIHHDHSGSISSSEQYQSVKSAHAEACGAYLGWVRHNALAATSTRDDRGRFGMWWGAALFGNVLVSVDSDGIDHSAENSTDYRNQGTPQDSTWGNGDHWLPGAGSLNRQNPSSYQTVSQQDTGPAGAVFQEGDRHQQQIWMAPDSERDESEKKSDSPLRDPNDRGRGRTVETQIGGLALLRAYWELSQGIYS